jgi:UDP-3-O-[3-hydroxymyristoyl] N-acetylglucosamine deacetylase
MSGLSEAIAPSISGVGLHSGILTTVRFVTAPPGRGRYFVRVDLPGQPEIPATIALQQQTQLSTELVAGDARVRTVEHLLAALFAAGIGDLRIEIDGPEVPLLDGSARGWWEAIAAHPDFQAQTALTRGVLTEALWIHQGDQFVAAVPSSELRFSYGIDFEAAPIGNQWYSWSPEVESFGEAIAPARTFGLAHQIEQLRLAGLIKGGSLDNALVCSQTDWINPPLRFSNEPVRHKLLDLVGDLSLVGQLPVAHYMAYKASHNLHAQLALRLQALRLQTAV